MDILDIWYLSKFKFYSVKGPIQKIKITYKLGGDICNSPVQQRNCIQNDTAIHLLEWLKLEKQKLKMPNFGEDAEPVKTQMFLLGTQNGTTTLKTVWHLLIQVNNTCHTTQRSLSYLPQWIENYAYTKTCIFHNHQTRKQPGRPSSRWATTRRSSSVQRMTARR